MPGERDKARRAVEQALRETGLPYRIENGGRHKKIWLGGRMIGVMHNGSQHGRRDCRNLLAAIRRAS